MINNISSSSQIITTIPSLEDERLLRIVTVLIRDGHIEHAGKEACLMENANLKAAAFYKVAVAFQKQLNNTEKALEFALLIANNSLKNEALEIITSDLIDRNNLTEASKTLQLIHPTPELLAAKLAFAEDRPLFETVKDLISKGQIEQAGEKARLLKSTDWETMSLYYNIAVEFQKQLNNTEKALEFVLLLDNNWSKNDVLRIITSDLINRNNRREALKTLQLIQPTSERLAAKLSKLCTEQEDFDAAGEDFDIACTSAKLILAPHLQRDALIDIALRLCDLNKFDQFTEFAKPYKFWHLDMRIIEKEKKAYLDATNSH